MDGDLVFAIYVAFRAHVSYLAPAGLGRADCLIDEPPLSHFPYRHHPYSSVCLSHCHDVRLPRCPDVRLPRRPDDRLLPTLPPILLDADLLGPHRSRCRDAGDVPISIRLR